MLVTKIYKGQGLGNQLWCYVVTRVIASDKKYEFGIESPENFKCLNFINLDTGKKVIGGDGIDGQRPKIMPKGIKYYYKEKESFHPITKADIRDYDNGLTEIRDNTKIDGIMQGEKYIIHRKNEIKNWLAIKPKDNYPQLDYDNLCVINFRGGEYVNNRELFLPKSYWENAMKNIKKINQNVKFIVITDDAETSKKFFSDLEIKHFSIAGDYYVISQANYLILSNSSFAWFPAWLNQNLKFCIAPKYWARHNVSNGYWSCGYNITSNWTYQDRNGGLFSYEECEKEWTEYKNKVLPKLNNKLIKTYGILYRNFWRAIRFFKRIVYDKKN